MSILRPREYGPTKITTFGDILRVQTPRDQDRQVGKYVTMSPQSKGASRDIPTEDHDNPKDVMTLGGSSHPW